MCSLVGPRILTCVGEGGYLLCTDWLQLNQVRGPSLISWACAYNDADAQTGDRLRTI